jgi:POT family proton-dependent oligopeptide transporter
MLKEHPKGLYVAFFANMGERFGFYTMVAIFVLFLQAKYGLSAAAASQVYGIFMASVYFLPVVGGLIADRFLGYGKTISVGLITMFIGYFLLAIPSPMGTGFSLIIIALAVIALGTGLFKGNLQALVGNLYDEPAYNAYRDRGFNIFYMGINIGAMFAPTAAEAISNYILAKSGFFYDARIPALAHKFLKNKLTDIDELLTIANAQDSTVSADNLANFCHKYIDTLSKSYHFGFGVACISLIISMIIFWSLRKYYAKADITEKQKAKTAAYKETIVELTPEQTRQRITALFLVFIVVIFFWMSFHQSGLTMTYFARDYTRPTVGKLTNLWFDLFGLLPIFLSVLCLALLIKNKTALIKALCGIGFILFAILAYLRYQSYQEVNPFTPQKFQHFNPFFIVVLTPIVISIFAYLNKRGKEPSAPRKIGIGMLITAVSFAILAFGSVGLPSPKELGGQVAPSEFLVSPYWLISTYFLLTIAELFLSPMGISFVSRVAPPKYKGLMQGFWFAATATGNYLLAIIGALWSKVPLWALWGILVACCLISAIFIFSIMKKLETATST